MGVKPRHPCPTVGQLQSVAKWPVLHKHAVISLIQGFCPDRGGINVGYFCLDEYADQFAKINVAEASGSLTFPIKPSELVIWCNKHDVPLPEIFVSEVTAGIIRVRRPKLAGKYTDELVLLSENDHNRDCIRKGRKPTKETTIRGYEATITLQAREYVRSYVEKNGDVPQKWRVNRHLAKTSPRLENKINRAYDLSALLSKKELINLERKFRRQRQQDVADGLYATKKQFLAK